MKLSLPAFAFYYSTLVTIASGQSLCGNYANIKITLEETCTKSKVKQGIRDGFDASPTGCSHNFRKELFLITGKTDMESVNDYLDSLCDSATKQAASTAGSATWKAIVDAGADLGEFFKGDGFLNLETGNFRQDSSKFNPDRFIYTGEDPRLNDHYPTTEASYKVGQAIENFEETVQTKTLQAPAGTRFVEGCKNQAVMCCWERDRQYLDGNGNCRAQNCANKDPGDNTNLCWTDDGSEVIPYPGTEEEGPIHCHGFAWSDKADDPISQAKWNTLFYVSMYDHLYKRGYVENAVDVQDMCGCIEDMNPVTRADCSEVDAVMDYNVAVTGINGLSVTAVSGTYKLEFQSCRGIIFNTEQRKNNDLSAHVWSLVLQDKMSTDTLNKIFEVLVGYDNPNNRQNEDACAEAYELKYGKEYPDE